MLKLLRFQAQRGVQVCIRRAHRAPCEPFPNIAAALQHLYAVMDPRALRLKAGSLSPLGKLVPALRSQNVQLAPTRVTALHIHSALNQIAVLTLEPSASGRGPQCRVAGRCACRQCRSTGDVGTGRC
jgi:hypothetical protein